MGVMSDIFELFRKIEKNDAPARTGIEFIVAGLGNPGAKYERTRHNAGFRAISALYEKCGITREKSRFESLCAEGSLDGHGVLFLRPQTYMNASGAAVGAAADFYRIPPERVIVICDDVNLDVGRMRIRRQGSSGGQKGVADIITCLGSDAFPRIKIGVGKKPSPEYDLADWVLGRFSADDEKKLADVLEKTADAVRLTVCGRIGDAMNLYN